ncbi:MAG: acylase, partial [Bacteroidetes bacterium]|nr:acylase [Bacteroidota bacterium]
MRTFRRSHQFLSFFLLLILVSCTTQKSDEIRRWETQAEEVTIIRDTYGVAHIYGETDANVVFGMLYAQCEDDFNRVEV